MASDQDSQPLHWHFVDFDDHDFQIRGSAVFLTVVLFAILLILALIFIYARWLCSSRHPQELSQSSHAPPPPPPQQTRGLDSDTINALPLTMMTSGSECCICLGVFEDGEKAKVLPHCQHCFHPECVDRWLSSESSCPLCRTSLRVESDRVLHQNIPAINVNEFVQ
ncbi:RING-H2 finger protein ATL72 [Hibiscus syriacus]|uniref:RING-type E3 ubiquitin transferase n=1 Tax=Hibiscus syriacus TaxID=106335 RepID=A0A6A3AX19_HIBSY|nr:RING-H2 finger protein ATL66-like [Hibiscus syriacus]KAE8708966.1 RING-H2 finger protein ATL72 [Hibiscus syriacus]